MGKLHLVIALGVLAPACTFDDSTLGDPDEQPQEAANPVDPQRVELPSIIVSRAESITAAMDRTEHAFHPGAGSFEAYADTHAVRLRGDRVEVTPIDPEAIEDAAAEQMPMGLTTEAIQIGRTVIPTPARGASAGPNGELRIDRGAVIEQLVNDADGVEQSWWFASRPAGDGALRIAVAVADYDYTTTTPLGLHFSREDELGFVYSHGLWIDARGEETPVPASFEGGRIVLTVPADVVAASSFPAVLDPTIASESAVDTAVTSSPTGANARTAQVAFSGAQYLVVWKDDRSGTSSNIYAMRLTATLGITDTVGLAVSTAAGVQDNPTVAFVGGTSYLVAWEDYTSAALATPNVVAATVTTAGVVGTSIAVATGGTRPRLAGRGTGALLVWGASGNVSASVWSGTAFGTALSVAATADAEVDPVVAANPSGEYLVAFVRGAAAFEVTGQRVTSAGALSGAAFDLSAASGSQEQPALTFDGTNFVAVWSNNSGTGSGLYGSRVSTAGAVLDTRLEGAATVGGVALAAAGQTRMRPAVTCLSGGCLLAWQDRRSLATQGFDLYGQLVTSALAASGGEITIAATTREQRVPALVSNATGYLAIWQDTRDGGAEAVYGARITSAGVVTDASGVLVARGNNSQSRPAVVRGPSSGSTAGWLEVWSDSRVAGSNIQSVSIGNGGGPGNTVTTISSATGQQATPVAANNGTQYVVAWSDARNGVDDDVYAARVTYAGAVTDTTGIALGTATRDQLVPDAMGTDGGLTLIAWQDRRNGNFDIYGAIVNTSGTLVASDIAISTAVGDQLSPRIAYDDTNDTFVVVWSDARGGAGTQDVYATRVTEAGVVQDPSGVVITSAANAQNTPDIVYGGGRFLIVWDDRRNTTADIYGARVAIANSALTVTDTTNLAILQLDTSKQTQPAVTYMTRTQGQTTTQSFFVAWTDERNLASTAADLYGALISSTGTIGTAFALSQAAGDESKPALSKGRDQGQARTILTYLRYVSGSAATRAMVRRITFGNGDF